MTRPKTSSTRRKSKDWNLPQVPQEPLDILREGAREYERCLLSAAIKTNAMKKRKESGARKGKRSTTSSANTKTKVFVAPLGQTTTLTIENVAKGHCYVTVDGLWRYACPTTDILKITLRKRKKKAT